MTAASLLARGVLVVVAVSLLAWQLGDVLDHQWIDAQVRGRGMQGYAIFLATACVLMTLGLSRQLIALLAGYGFGFQSGLLLSMAAVVAACVLTYILGRQVLRSFLTGRFGERIGRIRDFVHNNTFVVTLLFRLLPLGSNWMMNVAAGVSGFPRLQFFTASALGYLPQMTIFVLIGSGVAVGQRWQLGIAVLTGIIALLLAVGLYRHYRLEQRLSAGSVAG